MNKKLMIFVDNLKEEKEQIIKVNPSQLHLRQTILALLEAQRKE